MTVQYNFPFYVNAIARRREYFQRSFSTSDDSHRGSDRRYGWRSDGVSVDSVLRVKTSCLPDDDRNDYRVILRGSIDLRAGLGPCFRSLWPAAGAADRAECVRCGVYGIRFRERGMVAVPLPDRAGPWRRDDRRGAGVYRRHRPVGCSPALPWWASTRTQPGTVAA